MPRDITVIFEDGSSHVYKNAPDDLTPEAVATRASSEYGKAVKSLDGGKADEGFLATAGRYAKNIGTGLAKGFAGLATAAGDALADDPQIRLAQLAANKGDVEKTEATRARVGDVSAAVAPLGYQPRDSKEKIIQALAAGVGAGLSGPGAVTSPIRAGAIGLAGAGGAQVGSEISGGNKAAMILGGVLGGGTAGVASALRGNTPALAREALRDVRPEDLAVAAARQSEAQASGVPVNLAQAMPKPSNIDTIVNALANSRYGKAVTKQLRDQPQQVAFGMEDQLANLPGNVRAPQIVANNMQEAATGVIDAAKKARGNAWKESFEAGVERLRREAAGKKETVSVPSAIVDESGAPIMTSTTVPASSMVGSMPESAVSSAYSKLAEMAAARPNTGLGNMLQELGSRLKDSKGNFITDTEQLNGVLKDVTARLKSPDLASKGVDAGGVKFLSNAINDLRTEWGDKFAPFRDANAKFAQITDEAINPLKKSVVGDIAGRRGALPDVEAVKGRLNSVFEAGTVPGAKSSEILTLEKAVRAIPESETSVSGAAAYQDAVKSWMASKISAASKQVGGRVDDGVAAHLEQTFMGNDTKAQGFKDMLVGLARSKGLKDDALLPGMQNFLKVVSMAARRPGSVQGVSAGGAAEVAGRTIANAGGQTTVNPLRNAMLRWSERLQSDAYSEMDRLLTSPEGVATLQKLAKQPAMSPAAQTAVATYLGTNAAMADETQEYPK